MTLFMSKLMSGIVELLIVSVIPFITWLIWSRKKVGFFDWIGLKKVESQQKRRLLLTILGISLLFLLFSIVYLCIDREAGHDWYWDKVRVLCIDAG